MAVRTRAARTAAAPELRAPASMGEFVAMLESRGELRRVRVPVSAELEITEITDRVSKGPAGSNVALLFENVRGHDIPVATNLFGSASRMALALGAPSLDAVGERLGALLSPSLPRGVRAVMDRLRLGLEAARAMPHRVEKAPAQEVVVTGEAVRLSELPILKCWPEDGGRYITLPLVITRDPVSGVRNVGMYRLQEYDDRTLGMHWQIHKGGA
ncbi:MAG TPA: UbiD family decarboxylase domain-containing protein, partial [Candidatus Angelobacter sp.]|nr:UbiD family decarboxylase domain-containing protein [Candidatus Angelobacter sp.]